jgi:hypothetical protein
MDRNAIGFQQFHGVFERIKLESKRAVLAEGGRRILLVANELDLRFAGA